MRRFLIALQFLTRFPLKLSIPPSAEEIGASMVYFPVVGLCLGGYLVFLNKLFAFFFPPLLADAFLLLGLVLATGAMHLDGLADTVDGFYAGGSLPPGSERKEKIFTAMKDSHIGVMGALAVFFVLLLKLFALNSLGAGIKTSVLLITPMLSRWCLLWAAVFSEYANSATKGLGEVFTRCMRKDDLMAASVLPCFLSLLLFKFNAVIIILLIIAILFCLINYIKSKIDGVTGDTFGAVNEIMETVATLLALIITA